MSWKRVATVTLTVTFVFSLSCLALHAQRGPGGGARGGPPLTQPSPNPANVPSLGQPNQQSPFNIPPMQPFPKATVVEDEVCLPWAISAVRGATVSVARLAVPSKARGDFEKACGDFKKKKLPEAEQHFRDAIQKYSNYSAAWVMLGQVLQERGQAKDATEACSHALDLDATYLPPYLCLAELATRGNLWDRVLELSNHALSLNPVGDGYAYYYRAMAYFHLNNVEEARNSASNAAGIEGQHHEPGLYFLLAQIYEAEGDAANAAAQLKQFLKFNNDRQQQDAAQQYLAKLEAQQAPKQQAAK
jgi:predicted Zn-dependent protease